MTNVNPQNPAIGYPGWNPSSDAPGFTDRPDRVSEVQGGNPVPDRGDVMVMEAEAEPTSDAQVFAVDAYTGDVYHGNIHSVLSDEYNSGNRRNVTTAHNLRRDGNAPILARQVTRFDDVTNKDVTTWYYVDEIPLGPLPGEWKLIHLTTEV